MQLIRNGPDIPDTLLQAHEDGRVVFFCGAGISYPAGLPGFEGLVNRLYEKLGGISPNAVEQAALERDQYDKLLGYSKDVLWGAAKRFANESRKS